MLVGEVLDVWLRQQYGFLGEQWVGRSQWLAALIECLYLAGCHSHRVGVTILQSCIVEFHVTELFCLQCDVFLQTVHIVAEIFLCFLEFLCLQFEGCQIFHCIVLFLYDGIVEGGSFLSHRVEGFLQLCQCVVGFYIFTQRLLHIINNVGTFCVVGTIESIYVLMPLVEVAQFLVVDMAIYTNSLDAVFHHEALYHRCNDFFINLMYAEWDVGGTVVFCCPLVCKEVVANSGTISELEWFITLNGVRIVELFVLDSSDFLCFQQWGIMIVRSLENFEEQVV